MTEDEGANGAPADADPDARSKPETTDDESAASDEATERDDGEDETEGEAPARERIDDLEAELENREARIDDLESRLKRTQADFQNYKKRQQKRQEQLEERATEDLVERLLDVRENLKRALDEDPDDVDALREGVEMTLSEFDRVLDAENVREVDPEPGEPVDPQRHEVMLRIESDQPEGTIAEVYRSGYEMGEKILRPAQVTVSDGSGEE